MNPLHRKQCIVQPTSLESIPRRFGPLGPTAHRPSLLPETIENESEACGQESAPKNRSTKGKQGGRATRRIRSRD